MRPAQLFWAVFLPYALGHFLSSLLRTVNAVLAPQLATAFSLSHAQLGVLSGAYFFAFALVQLPVGMALDRYGPRKVQGALLLVAAAGTLLFAGARSFAELALARLLIGAGLGACFMAAMKALAGAVEKARLPSMSAYVIAAGGLGAAAATLPADLAATLLGWRGLFLLLALLVAVLSAFIWLAAPHAPAPPAAPRASLASMWREPVLREAASLVAPSHMVFFGLQGLWMGRWLADVAHLPEAVVAWQLYLTMAALVFGAIAVGRLAEWAQRRGMAVLDLAAWGVAIFVAVQGAIAFGYGPSCPLLCVLFTLTGAAAGLEYAIVAAGVPPALAGRASTCLNLLVFSGAFAVQAGFGLLLALWPADAQGCPPPQAYSFAFGLLACLQLPGLVQWRLRFLRRKDHHETVPLRPAGKGKARHI